MFLGEHQHNLDAKGRVTFPLGFVSCSGSDAVLSPAARTDASRCTGVRSGT